MTNDPAVEAVTQQFTVGRLDAGLAVLLCEDHHVVEIPATLLPLGVSTGSIVDVTIERNEGEEVRQRKQFAQMQQEILAQFGEAPEAPTIRVAHVAQTSVTLAWEPFVLRQADFFGVDVLRNQQKLSSLPHPLTRDSTRLKLSGLDVATAYELQLVVRTSAGALESNTVAATTLALDDLQGLSLCIGQVPDSQERARIEATVKKWGATLTNEVTLDTTHLVTRVGAGPAWEAAREQNVPIVNPDFVAKCDAEHKVQPVGPYYVPASA